MTLPNEHHTATTVDQQGEVYGELMRIVAELDEIAELHRKLLARRDTEMRRLRAQNRTSVAMLRNCTGLSKSSVRLITSERRGD